MTPNQRRLPLPLQKDSHALPRERRRLFDSELQKMNVPVMPHDSSYNLFRSTVPKILSLHRSKQTCVILNAKLIRLNWSFCSFIYNGTSGLQDKFGLMVQCYIRRVNGTLKSSTLDVQVSDVSLHGIFLQKGLCQTAAHMGTVDNQKDYEVLSRIIRNCRAPQNKITSFAPHSQKRDREEVSYA